MNDKPFPRSVRVTLPGSTWTVSSAYQALECLLGPWPITTIPEYRSAVRACRDCLDGLRTPKTAFNAFKKACRATEGLNADTRVSPQPTVSEREQEAEELNISAHAHTAATSVSQARLRAWQKGDGKSRSRSTPADTAISASRSAPLSAPPKS
ncbi:DUF982 domain-containing protein [Chelativorans sp. YIM 93263]|uniref:DUF982 domain-containing protein n=1 Tax=Chelativorans sp. YIM 93263 TaxID=2906648 RepID=UPI00403E1F81